MTEEVFLLLSLRSWNRLILSDSLFCNRTTTCRSSGEGKSVASFYERLGLLFLFSASPAASVRIEGREDAGKEREQGVGVRARLLQVVVVLSRSVEARDECVARLEKR